MLRNYLKETTCNFEKLLSAVSTNEYRAYLARILSDVLMFHHELDKGYVDGDLESIQNIENRICEELNKTIRWADQTKESINEIIIEFYELAGGDAEDMHEILLKKERKNEIDCISLLRSKGISF